MGSVGLYAVLGDAHNVAPYYFPALIGQIKARLPADASVSRVSEIVKEEVEKFSSWFDVYLKRGLLQQEDSPGDYPLEYLIAGYQAGVPTIYSIYVEVDWQHLHLKGIQRVLMHHERNGQEDLAIYGAGSKGVLQELKQEQGDLYQRVISKAPSESRMLSGKRELSINQASNLVRTLLEVEAEANPEQVGPPFTIVTIPKNGPPLISSIDAHVHPEPVRSITTRVVSNLLILPVERLVGVKAVLLFKCISFPVVTFRRADRCLRFLIPRFAFLIEPWTGANRVIQNEKRGRQESQGFRKLITKVKLTLEGR